MQCWQLSKIYGQLLPLLVLSLTAVTLPSCTTTPPAKPFSSEVLPTEAIAEISEIRSYPVRIKFVNATSARPATVGASLKVNESVSTEDSSTAQLTMRSGAIIRIGGISNLTIKPKNQVEITSGRLVAWAASDRKTSAQIKTPFGEISSNDGTVYLEIPPKASEDRRIIALDGTVTFLLKGTSEVVTLGKGEEIRIKADGKASSPKRIDKESIDKRIANNALIFGFNTQLASLPQISTEFGVAATFKEASTIQFRRSDLPKKPSENNNSVKVPYSSGASSYSDRQEPVDRRREEPVAAKKPDKSGEPASTDKPNEPSPTSTAAPNPTAPIESVPITTNSPVTPVQPLPPQSSPSQPPPLEPPPQPVQPEILAPEPPPSKPPKSR